MRILEVICVASVLFITLLAVVADCEKQKEDLTAVSEVVQFSRDQFTGESVPGTSGTDLWPIIRVRRGQEIAAVTGEATKGRGVGGKKNNKKEKGAKRRRGRDGKGKGGKKKGPLTRHAKGPHKNAGTNRTHPRQRSHDKRNLEKQFLVRNRTLELFQRKTTDAANLSFVYPVNKLRDAIFERRITPEKIGQILGDGRRAPGFRITDLLIPKTILEAGAKKNAVEIKDEVGPAKNSQSNYSQDVEVIRESCRPVETGSQTLFLGKLKSIAMNVSRMNKAVQKLKENDSEVETSPGKGDFGENSYRYDYEDVFEDPSVSPWVNPPQSEEAATGREDQEYYLDRALLSSVYMPIEDQVSLHQGLASLLSRLFQTLRNSTDYENRELLQDLDFDNSVQGDLCQKWLDCKDQLEEAFLGPLVLPACPCHYPSSIFYDDKIWDEGQERHFRWRDVSGEAERLDVYKPGATYCIRSLLAQGGGSAAAQHCCYDGRRRLLTRGSGAGTPNFVSPEVSAILHERIDVLPWRLCKGDFSRFNKVRPPNNDNHCKGNPGEDEYQRQIDTTKHY